MSKLGLLRAGFSAILGREVVLQEGGATFSIDDVLKQTHVMKPLGFRPPSTKPVHETFPIFVRGLFGSGIGFPSNTLTLQVTEGHSVFEMKLQIQEKLEIALEQFDLILGNKCLDDDRTVEDHGLQPRSTIYLVLRLKGGGGPFTISKEDLAPEFDYDFTDVKDDGQRYMRGGFEYKRPYGWKRFGLRALGRYENDDWLGPNGFRTSQARGEWPVSYYGTNMSSAEMIVKEGYKPGPATKFGVGIYTSPSLEMVERLYAQEFTYDRKRYKIAFQNRVNPDLNGHLKIISASDTGVEADYWLSPKDNNDVRPYGLLIREVRQTEQTDQTCSLI
ncbi:uncharacterized protein LOC110064851 [Orbicella faveolata]|uniref:uncharacterized protein LOC110064851 n=1 Tax=Orbicella faveolata TaxID=48498 RepID=UPI0009E4F7FC|nr:uncharacterized protein LOC110064851 [Orbicella faveolata]